MSLPQARCHQLTRDLDECFSLDLDGPYRLILKVVEDPIPRRRDGGIDPKLVRRVQIFDIVDTHQEPQERK